VVLLSGGLDSSTVLAQAIADGFAAHALTVSYGQRHAVELHAARRVARALGAHAHQELSLDLRPFGGSALTDDAMAVPRDREDAEIGEGIPATYVPARNTILLSLSLAWAEVLGATDLYLGVSALDYSGYPDCRPGFVAAFEHLANEATRQGAAGAAFRVHAPLLALDKTQTIELGLSLGVDYGLTWTCYDPQPGRPGKPPSEPLACGRCDACRLRRAAFEKLGRPDPVAYVHPSAGSPQTP